MTKVMTSNKPYLVRAFYDWLSDNQLTPYILVDVSVHGVIVPINYVKNGEIVLNISAAAVGAISLGVKAIEFSARFGGVLEHLYIPYGAIGAIYAKENGVGTALPIEHLEPEENSAETAKISAVETAEKTTKPKDDGNKPKGRPSLKVVK